MAPVKVAGLRKRFGEVEAISGFDMEVADGELMVLVGPSGCGKTTLLRIIAGLEPPDAGEIRIGERLVNDVPPKDRDIAMVFQNYALYPHMTVRQNLMFGLKARGTHPSIMVRRLEDVAAMLGLGPLLDRYPKQLSGGQRQRVAMGRAIVRNPQVFLFDEPLSNLDANLRVRMRTEIKALQQSLRTTAIYVTHDQGEAMTIADRIVVMDHGRAEQIGTPLQIYDRPANRFVAGFIGSPSMNFLEGSIRRTDGRAWFRSEGGALLPIPQNGPGEEGRAVVLGVRPEHLQPASAEGLSATVSVVEPTGPITYVFSSFAGATICSAVVERCELRPGEPIRLCPRVDGIHLFDARTGTALR
jgi:multiple sugar transport system ATP-binding protein